MKSTLNRLYTFVLCDLPQKSPMSSNTGVTTQVESLEGVMKTEERLSNGNQPFRTPSRGKVFFKVKVLVLKSCLSLCDPIDCGPPGSSDHGFFSGKNTGVGSHSFLQGMYLLRNLYAGREATVTTRHEMMDWFQIQKGVHQGCILSPC